MSKIVKKNCQNVLKKLSKKLPKNCKKVVKKLSKKLTKSCQKSCQKVVKVIKTLVKNVVAPGKNQKKMNCTKKKKKIGIP
jgi:dipeptidase